jgi:hypothetical protein
MYSGSCLCQSIQFTITGELGPTMICHCTHCRKGSGTGFAMNALINKPDFNVIQGKQYISEYESSPGVFRTFCQTCGSPLYSYRTNAVDTLRLKVGTLDSDMTIEPKAHIFVGSKASWDVINDDIDQYDKRP